MISPLSFLMCNIVVSILLGMVLLIRKAAGRHLTAKARYRLWYLFTASLFLPFCPTELLRNLPLRPFFVWLRNVWAAGSFSAAGAMAADSGSASAVSGTAIRDFSAAVAASGPSLPRILLVVWIAGMLAVGLYFFGALWQIRRMLRQAFPVTKQAEPELYRLFSDCRRSLSVRQPVRLYTSCAIQTPVSCGLLHPAVIIPQDLDIVSTEEELRFIFLHELQHCKSRDALLNLLVCAAETLYWFNPFLWYGFCQLKKDRELACDHAVLCRVGQENRTLYGLAILRFTEARRQGIFASPLSGIGTGASATRQRIAAIAQYQAVTPGQKLKSAGIFFLVFVLVLSAVPFLTAHASGTPAFHLTGERWQEAAVSDLFCGRDGGFVLYDMGDDSYYIYNRTHCETRFAPASTYKICSGLFALEEGCIKPDASGQPWDGSAQPFDTWMQDQTLTTAMHNSVNWYFQNLDARMGTLRLAAYYSRVSYGNCDISGGVRNYWADSSLKISPLEQVRFLSGFLTNQWGFSPENVQAVKDALLLSEDPAAGIRLYGKTGTSADADGTAHSGWFTGFLETPEHTYCFAVHMEGDGCDGNAAADTALAALRRVLTA